MIYLTLNDGVIKTSLIKWRRQTSKLGQFFLSKKVQILESNLLINLHKKSS